MEVHTKVTVSGKIQYFQDFTVKVGELNGAFTVVDITHTGACVLEAPGYGAMGDYGSGHIYVYGKYKKQLIPM